MCLALPAAPWSTLLRSELARQAAEEHPVLLWSQADSPDLSGCARPAAQAQLGLGKAPSSAHTPAHLCALGQTHTCIPHACAVLPQLFRLQETKGTWPSDHTEFRRVLSFNIQYEDKHLISTATTLCSRSSLRHPSWLQSRVIKLLRLQ